MNTNYLSKVEHYQPGREERKDKKEKMWIYKNSVTLLFSLLFFICEA
jgi:hypothetical protein